MIIISLLIAWWLIGAVSYVFWWTTEFDLTTEEIPTVCLMGMPGPFSFLFGWMIHRRRTKRPGILIERRR